MLVFSRFISMLAALPLLFCLFLLSACNSDNQLGLEPFVEKKLTNFLTEQNGQVVSIAIVSEQHSYQRHFGQLPDGTLTDNTRVYEIASITKTYVGLLLAKAVEDKKVKLDEDIRTYLPNSKLQNLHFDGQPITLRHLATHRSGLPADFSFTQKDKEAGIALDLIASYTKEKLFEDLRNFQLQDVPGETFQYSNVGTDLTGYILEEVYGKTLSKLVSEFITDKSGEEQTRFRLSPQAISEITIGTDDQGNEMPLLSPHSFADGGLTSSTQSISKYMQYLLSTNAPEVALSQTLLAGSEKRHGHAFFWNTYKYKSEQFMLYHSGGSIGTSSWLAIYPKLGVGIFIVTNVAAGNTQGELNDIANDILDKYQETTSLN